MNKYNCKLLSHRLRGLAEFEHSSDSFKQTGSLKIKYFELDTRVSKDGVIYVFHDNKFKVSGVSHEIANLTAKEITYLNHKKDDELLLLRDALQLFSEHASQDQMLCIDIKDYGFEKEHLDLVREYHLEHRVIFITWIPQAIIRLKEIGARTPLILSCWNIRKLDPVGKLISHAVSGFARSFRHYVVLGESRITDSLQGLSIGFQHALVCTEIPEVLLNILEDSGGGICIHKSMYCRNVGDYCKANNLQLWLYNENNPQKFKRLAENDLVHVIFSDMAPTLSRGRID